MDFGIAGVAAITVIAYVVGLIVKATPLNDKWIPIICGVAGAGLGIVGMLIMPDFPANDYISASAVGIVSGLAATGVNQAVKQLSSKTEIDYKTGYYNVIEENQALLKQMAEKEVDDMIPNKAGE